MTTVIGSIREYFLLSDARATAKVVPEDARVALDRQLAVGRQRSEAADALWSNGHVAEGLRLAAEAFDATVSAVAPFADAIAPPGRAEPALREEPVEEASEASATEAEEAKAEEAKAEEAEAEETNAEEPKAEDANAETEGASEAKAEAEASDAEAKTEDTGASESEEAAEAEAAAAGDEEAERASDATADTIAAEPATPPVAKSEDGGEPAWVSTLRRRGLSEGKTREVVETSRLRQARTLPMLDDEVTASDGELFQQLVLARRHVDRVLAPASMTPGQLQWTRVSRIGFASFLAIASALGLYLLLRPPTGVEATATGQYSAEFTAERAVDGDEATEWLLPDRSRGSIDVRIMPPERIDTLRLKNSHNRHYNDRATNEYTIQVYSNGQVARTIEGSWQGIAPRPEWTEHALGVDDVERIHVEVRSWHRNGGGLAEIDWE